MIIADAGLHIALARLGGVFVYAKRRGLIVQVATALWETVKRYLSGGQVLAGWGCMLITQDNMEITTTK